MITIICSTNRKDSVSRIIAGIYQENLKELEEESEIIDMKDLPEDFLVSALYENAGKNISFNPLRERMVRSEKFVFIIPEYNGSFPGVLKLFIDGLKFPDTFTGKKCALVGVSSGIQGGVLAMSHLTDIMNYCGTHVLSFKPKLSGISSKLSEGKLTDELYNQFLKRQACQLKEF
jgi:NAD(P)H-dependent FMN reductase